MAHQKPTNTHYSRLPSLRVDSVRAQHQNQDAVILPIEYDLTEPANNPLQADTLIIPIYWPVSQITAVLNSLEIADEGDRKRKLALLKVKVDAARKTLRLDARQQRNRRGTAAPIAPSKPIDYPGQNFRRLKTAVPLLLFGVVVLVIFAWTCFR